MKTMRRLSLALALLAAAPAVVAQQPQTGVTIVLKDGKTVTAPRLRRNGANVMVAVQIGAGAGEVGYAVSSIAKIEFPEPPEIKRARDFLAEGKAGEALGVLRPVMDNQEPFRDVPGNWWQQAAQLKLGALVAAGRDSEAEMLIGQLEQSSTDPETLGMAKVQQAASWARKGRHEKALPVYDAALKEAKSRDTLAFAWLNKGHSLLALRKWEPAILAYLQVPVFYSDSKLLVPQALLGSARAMAGLLDYASATAKYNEIIETFPASPEAATAKTELEKLNKKQ
jgi:tetratricopeptide (TPR) repeat protein